MQILYNANILTFDSDSSHATALAIHDSKIVAVGNDITILDLAQPGDKKEDLSGQTIIPGMTDAHIHLLQYAQSLAKLNFENCSKSECLSKVRSAAEKLPSDSWILGHGWDQNNWKGEQPVRSELDNVASQQPVYLTSRSLHSAWVNSKTLQLADISANTPDPPGGMIGRDEHGDLTGILYDNAVLLVERKIPPPTLAEASQLILAGIQELHKLGLTAIHDFDDPLCFEALQELNVIHQLNLRVSKNIPITKWKKPIAELPRSYTGDDFLRFGSLKLFADGALGSRTASMFERYDDIDSTGLLVSTKDQMLETGKAAIQSGISLAIHAIGDRANHEVLQAFRDLRVYEREQKLAPLNHRIEHVQCLQPKELKDLKKSSIVASVQPVHAVSDREMAHIAWGSRTKFAYPLIDLFDTGIKVVFGTDAPVENPNPFHTIHAAVTRNLPGNPPGNAFYPEQAVSLYQAFQATCFNPQEIIYRNNQLGTIQTGKFADLCVLPNNPFAVDPDSLYNMKISATMVAGKWVYRL